MKTFQLFCLFWLPIFAIAQNQAPQIINVTQEVDTENKTITLSFDISDNEMDEVEIELYASDNNGNSFDVPTTNAVGDIGFPIAAGTNKTISWSFADVTMVDSLQIKILVNDQQTTPIEDIVDLVDQNSVAQRMDFVEGIRHRSTGVQHLMEVRDELKNLIAQNNLELATQVVPLGTYNGENIIGIQTGLGDPADSYIIDAHYDTVNDSPGADDNGSGTVGVMEALEVLSQFNFKKTIRYVGFDLEEDGLVGSFRYVNSGIQDYETIEGVINLEMIGYFTEEPNTQTFPPGFEVLYPELYASVEADSFRGNFITLVGDQNSIPLLDNFKTASNTYVPELITRDLAAPDNWQVFTPDLGRSDHAPFWINEIPALMITDGSEFRNPFYHSPQDLNTTLNTEFMTNVIKATVAAVAESAELCNCTSYVYEFALPTNTLDLNCNYEVFQREQSLNIQPGDCTADGLTVDLFNLAGQKLFSRTVKSNTNFSTDHLGTGIYLLKVSDGSRFDTRKIFIRE